MSLNKQVRRIAIIGTGVIGASWAAQYLARGFDVWDSDEFSSPGRQLPKSIFIAGGGPVGVEFATILRDLRLPSGAPTQ